MEHSVAAVRGTVTRFAETSRLLISLGSYRARRNKGTLGNERHRAQAASHFSQLINVPAQEPIRCHESRVGTVEEFVHDSPIVSFNGSRAFHPADGKFPPKTRGHDDVRDMESVEKYFDKPRT